MIFAFIILYIFALFASKLTDSKQRVCLIVVCLILAFMAGIRDVDKWNDTGSYVMAFDYNTPTMFHYNGTMKGVPYGEKGFFLIGVVVKTFINNYQVYLLVVSLLTFFFLFKDFRRYTAYPLLGLCIYVSRFYLGRNLMQIRAGLAYAIILLGVRYVTERNWKKYFLVIFIAYFFHKSALIAIPLYFMGSINIKKKHVVMLILFAFILTMYFTPVLQQYVTDNASDLEVTNYVTGVEIEQAKGLRNPMIYFQCLWLFMFTFGEGKIKKHLYDYNTIRNAYLLSTFILITFSMFLGLSGRTSTCFATLEFVIIPSIIYLFKMKYRSIFYLGLGIMLVAILYMNLSL